MTQRNVRSALEYRACSKDVRVSGLQFVLLAMLSILVRMTRRRSSSIWPWTSSSCSRFGVHWRPSSGRLVNRNLMQGEGGVTVDCGFPTKATISSMNRFLVVSSHSSIASTMMLIGPTLLSLAITLKIRHSSLKFSTRWLPCRSYADLIYLTSLRRLVRI